MLGSRWSVILLSIVISGCARKVAPATESLKRVPVSESAPRITPAKMSELVEQATHALEAGNAEGSLEILNESLAADPLNRAALLLKSRALQRKAGEVSRPVSSPLFLESARAIRQLAQAYPNLTDPERRFEANVFYNESCTLALDGELESAVKSLSQSFEAGFDDLSLLDSDPELDSLRKLPEFHALQRSVERKNAESIIANMKPFAFDFQLPTLEGKQVKLADFKGKFVVVDFWGTWCPPSRKLIPHLAELADRHKDEGLAVIGLAFENDSGVAARQAIGAFVKDNHAGYPCLIGDDPTRNKVPRFEGYPTTLFINRAGKVKARLTGYQSRLTLESVFEAVRRAEKPPG